MMNFARGFALGLLVTICMALPVAAQDDVVEITAMGEGISQEAACHAAMRNALEQGAGVEISSHSNTQDFELIRDTIYARADGIISEYRVLEQGDAAGGVKYCKILAKVKRSAIASTWGEVQNVLDQIGRPGIAVYIEERIDGIIQDSSILESQIENRLLEAGFKVYAGQHLRRIAEKESDDAASEQNVAKVQAIAKDFGTQIFIMGTAQANSAGVRNISGQDVAMYNGDGMIKMYYTDTGELLASESLANWRGGARGYHTISPQAGKKALENAGQELVDRCYRNVMRQWATRITAGGELVLEVEGMSVVDAIKLKKMLKDIDTVSAVNHSMTKGIATFHIRAKMTAETLAEHLVGDEFASIIELVDLKTNRLQAKKVGG